MKRVSSFQGEFVSFNPSDIDQQMQQIQSQLQIIDQQVASLQQQKIQYTEYIGEISGTISTLRGLDNPLNSNTTILPLPGNIYLRTKVVDYENALVNVGAGTIIPKPIPEAIKMLEERVKSFSDLLTKIGQEIEKMESTKLQFQQMMMAQRNQGIAPDPTKYS